MLLGWTSFRMDGTVHRSLTWLMTPVEFNLKGKVCAEMKDTDEWGEKSDEQAALQNCTDVLL